MFFAGFVGATTPQIYLIAKHLGKLSSESSWDPDKPNYHVDTIKKGLVAKHRRNPCIMSYQKFIPILLFLVSVVDARLGSERRRSLMTMNIDFDGFQTGEIVTDLGNGISLTTMKRKFRGGPMIAGFACIFDTDAPTGGDWDLGTPNEDFGGPGKGKAGKAGSPVQNDQALHKVLIISEDDIATETPDDHRFGGMFVFDFAQPTSLTSIGLLDNEGTFNLSRGLGMAVVVSTLLMSSLFFVFQRERSSRWFWTTMIR